MTVRLRPSGRWTSLGTTAAWICLGLIFFTIAAVIIMSLIPLYLKSKPVTTQPAFYRSAPQTARLPIQNDGTFTPGDTLNEQGRTAIANQLKSAFATDPGIGNNAGVDVQTGTISQSSAHRKRKQVVQLVIIIVFIVEIPSGACSTPTCLRQILAQITKFLATANLIITIPIGSVNRPTTATESVTTIQTTPAATTTSPIASSATTSISGTSTSASSGETSTSASSGETSTSASSGETSTSASSGETSTSESTGGTSTSASSGETSTSESSGGTSSPTSSIADTTSSTNTSFTISTEQASSDETTTPNTATITTTVSIINNNTEFNITVISQYWSRLSPYKSSDENVFGVEDTGLPDGCQVEQAHILQRNGERSPSGSELELMSTFASQVTTAKGTFTGPLSYLNTWSLQLGTDTLLAEGISSEFTSGTSFWTNYGRLLFNAAPNQPFYNGTGQSKPVLRSPDTDYLLESTESWAKGFFYILNSPESQYTLVTIPTSEGNNTLASVVSCPNYLNSSYGLDPVGDTYIDLLPTFLQSAVDRLSTYAPDYTDFSATDVFTLQLLCIYEYYAFDNSDACSLFTVEEWQGFEYILDILGYYGYSFGQPAGRALGLGYLEELLARLNNQYITTSSSSVNSTLDSSSTTFPLNETFYLDMSDESTIVSFLTALSLDYFRESLPTTSITTRNFKLGQIIPFSGHLITEKIGCTQPNPTATNSNSTIYTKGQNGYSAAEATNKFVRIRLNNGILPLSTIRGGLCSDRTDGLCSLSDFTQSQSNASLLANYEFICFGSYVFNQSEFETDGNYGISSPPIETITTESNITIISQYWSRLSPYKSSDENVFGVEDTGLPDGCQVEQAHILQRNGEQSPSGSELELMSTFATQVTTAKGTFTGPLSYLNTWSLQLGTNTLLAEGVSSEFTSGTSFWTNYGRLLFNAAPNQPFYNGTGFSKPVLRSPDTDYILESTESWAKGFFYILNSPESQYTLVTIPTSEGNNTLASVVSCPNYLNSSYGLDPVGDTYIDLLPTFLGSAVSRLSVYAPGYTTFSATDVFTLQLLCIYEYYALDNSDACSLFTVEEWQGFEYILDILGYYGYSFGQPAGRALGLGYLQELLARLNNQYITTSSSSVNSTLDSSSTTFPLNETFYLDMSDESTIISLLTALSLDYFRESLPTTSITSRNFKLGLITPFSGHLITEKIGCTQPNPAATNSNSTIYTKGQNGYSAAEATNKFIRIRLNNGILPLSTIRGGLCSDRTDGLCSLSDFTQSQSNASLLANYEFICFGSYVFNQSEFEYDGNYGISSPPIDTTTPTTPVIDNTTESNITIISQYWSRLSAYKPSDENVFGVEDTGLPDGCQVEQAHILQRNGEQSPSGSELELMSTFANQVTTAKGTFTGPLSYLNTWSLQLGTDTLLAEGVSSEFTSGTSFWTNYGRLLFNAAPNQPFYNGTGQSKPVLRSPDTDYLLESTESWAKGFFYILNSPESQYTLVTIPTLEGNNTLASVISCPNYLNSSYGLDPVGDTYIDLLPTFLQSAVDRLSTYAPGYTDFSATDAFTLQLLCIYEYYAFDNSDACSLFTVEEWQGFEYILDILGYYGYSFGQPAGRALGLGYLQELLARLNNQYITTSSSSVNSTLDSSSTTFPLNETFYLDMSDESTIISLLTALSLDYFRESLPTTSITSRNFKLGLITPFSGHLITEKIGCTQPNPAATNSNSTIYTKGQNGYSAAEATNKFIRIRLNNGILPLSTIRGGLCSDRTDGLCSLSDFTQSQSNASLLANYEFICFGSYIFNQSEFEYDGNYGISSPPIDTTTPTTPVIDNTTESNITIISKYWSRLSAYKPSDENVFGVEDTGLPDGCQVEQAHILQRNGERSPSGSELELMSTFESQITTVKGTFTGPLSYLNTWSLQLGTDTLLAEGVSSEFTSGTSFWTNYGRLLFNAAPNQPFYNGTGFNKPVLRSPDTDALVESTESWAKGFFYILNSPESQYTLVTIPTSEGNNTLASVISCPNYLNSSYGLDPVGDTYIDLLPTFLGSAVSRLSVYAPAYTTFSATDVFTLQLLCIYEYYALDNSDACSLFTIEEWQAFEYILDILGYYGYSFGHPAARALGLGYLQELLARLNNEFITTSSSSVNSTLDSSSTTFPLNETFYLDMSDESTIISLLTALSLDYFRESLPTTSITSRNFKLGLITPFSGHLITEKIGCTQPNPAATNSNSTIYTKGQNGYSAAEATNKFIRIRLNNGILPLSTIRGGLCSDRTDGLCSLSDFTQSQSNASLLANYEFICFGSYVFNQSEFETDGNYGISSPPIETIITESNITIISKYWSRLSPYKSSDENVFGIEDTGLPDGCQIEQAHILQRNGEQSPSGSELELMSTFATQVTTAKGTFTGPLSYLNTWSLQLGTDTLLAEGISSEFTSGTSFWTNYGRLLFNAAPNQPFYNGTGFNKPVLRSPDTNYLLESTESWAKGFFYILNSPESQYTLVTIPTSEGNNTLASVVSCPNYRNSSYGLDSISSTYIDLLPTFLQSAVDRLSTYAPGYTDFSATDAFTLQLLCIYEYYAFDNSDACSLFTVEEWQGFEYILDILGYYGYSFGQPAGRALGLGYLQELLARLNNQYITTSSSSVNSTLDSSSTTFPLNETFYLDMSDESTIISLLTALSLDYFRESLPTTSITSRNFKLGLITPFSGHLITEKIGCTQPNPTATNSNSTIYTKGQNGYSAAEATNKFIRIRLNNGILPLSTIRGGLCADRTDGLCSLSDFTQSQSNASLLANYEFICFGSYVFNQSEFEYDGNYGISSPPIETIITESNITIISKYWSRLSAYKPSDENVFGVEDTGLPDGCQVEQAHILQRNGEQSPSGSELELMSTFANQVTTAKGTFTGPLSYLNTWSLQLGTDTLLAEGVSSEFTSGTSFWTNYGRLLFNAAPNQPFYNGTGQSKPVLRSPDTNYLLESTESWAKGFFYILNSPESQYTLVTIPTSEGNNTLASVVSCPNYRNSSYGLDSISSTYIDLLPTFLQSAVSRLSLYAPGYTDFSATDIFTLQLLCVYEYYALDNSDACSLFTVEEWQGFEYILDILGYYGYSFGQPAGRALGLGYLEELLARLNNQYITTSSSSVNSTLDSSSTTFPLNETFYFDMSGEPTIVSFLTALSLDYFRESLSTTSITSRNFKLGLITPFSGHLITEKIGCTQPNPTATNSNSTIYTKGQNGYSAASAANKFIRIRLNNGILPLSTIRGGLCSDRTDGLCSLSDFTQSQSNASLLANYEFICFGSYVFNQSEFETDGNYGISSPPIETITTESNITIISQYWSRLSPYKSSDENVFGVEDTGLPDGCQVEQAHILQRNGEQSPSGSELELMSTFATQVTTAKGTFIGPLSYLNTWSLQLGTDTLLAEGVSTEFTSGTSFWTNYGRLLFNAAPNQPFYNGTGFNKPVLRSPDTDYLLESTESWAKGFFYILNSPESQYTLVTIPTLEGNNTLASVVSCPNYLNSSYGLDPVGDTYIDVLPTFLQSAVDRLSTYAPGYTDFSATDAFTLQLLCIYEYYAFDNSDACSLFTVEEWQGFEYILDILGYYGYSFGQPAGRALGLGYLQELLARLNNQYITTSSSSVNSTLDSSPTTFPLNETFYLDMSDESTIVSFLTALSLDYFRESLPTTSITTRNFKLGQIIPFSGHLITEKIGCTQPNPTATNSNSTIYTKGQNGYSAASAANKFIRIRLNNGILPLSTIRGGLCSDRTDGLCSLSDFTQSQSNASLLANYEFICFGSYVFNQSEFETDGNYGISSPPIETITTESNITIISQYWSRLSPYKPSDENVFGVEDTGLPDGCQIEQAHILQRNGEQSPSESELELMNTFTTQVTTAKGTFTGPLSYLNTWSLQLGADTLLAEGVSTEFTSGTSFWTNYGRLLFNAAPNQPFYNGTGFNKPVLRSPDTDYLLESTSSWAKGFFYILNSPESQYTLVTIPTSEGNNTLASFGSCPNSVNSSYGLDPVGDTYIDLLPTFLQSAVDRLSVYAPGYTTFSATDVFTLQLLCIYEYYALDNSDACSLFTIEEWQAFEYILDILGYYGYSFGQPAGRALGLGYLEELLARLNNQYITTSSSSVNSTLDSSSTTFPLNETFYLDMSDESTIVSFLTAISLDYFRESLPTTSITSRNFKLGQITPFSGHLITEKIGCTQSNPTATNSNSTIYTKGQNGYSAASAANKFIRIRLNNGILPLSTIRGGLCSDRTDGLCSLSDFTQSQSNASLLANYEFICFGSYVFNQSEFETDGNYGISSPPIETTTPTTPVIDNTTESNITIISQYWSRLSAYKSSDENVFGVEDTGLPDGCQVEQAHILQRNGERSPSESELELMSTFATQVTTAKGTFTGPLSYLNTWSLQLGTDTLLAEGVSTEFTSGTSFWTNYGRLLFNAAPNQPFYNGTGFNKPVLRSPDTEYLLESTSSWAKGFFYILNSPESQYTLVTIPTSEGNNTLSSVVSCPNYLNSSYGLDSISSTYIDLLPTFLQSAVDRLSTYAPGYTDFSATDAFTLQLLCIYEYYALDNSDACSLFTVEEWQGFEYILDILGYYGYSFGQPAGRALGLGYLEELLARLNNQYITTSSSSVNSTLDSSSTTFPLNETFYLDMSDESTIISLLTALSLDYFRESLSTSSITSRNFKLGQITPFSGHLITEKIGCTQPNPTATNSNSTIYTKGQNGYSAAEATNKFVRIRLNNGILPLSTIRGGLCSDRTDGLCSLSNFIQSQSNASLLANYEFICFGSYVFNQSEFETDGNYGISSPPIETTTLESNITIISQYWSRLRPYKQSDENVFGVEDTGLPDGCQIEQAHILQRNGEQSPSEDEFELMSTFATQVTTAKGTFTGPLSYLNTWSLQLGADTLLAEGVSTEFTSGTSFWTNYGRLLFNAAPNQPFYNGTGFNKPVLRSPDTDYLLESTESWAKGFFYILNSPESQYTLVTIPTTEGNNTLSSEVSCPNYLNSSYGLDSISSTYIDLLPTFLQSAVDRLSTYAPGYTDFSATDVFTLQLLCIYEYYALDNSDACSLFTVEEWQGFEYILDILGYYGYSFGQPAGRALGLGYLEELLARLNNQYITTSSSSVNSTLDSSSTTFPLNETFYFDMSDESTIVSFLTALSLDYFRESLPTTSITSRNFKLGLITPFSGHLITEKIGCTQPNPTATNSNSTIYTKGQNGYSAPEATNKFIRIRLNNGILPLSTIRGGLCSDRTDGLCSLSDFTQSQSNASLLANYEFICFGSYVFNQSEFETDGNYGISSPPIETITTESNITIISQYWSRLSPYKSSDENVFGVEDTGLPDGCQIEQAHILQRNGERSPSESELELMNTFATQVTTAKGTFTGPLSYLNTWSLQLGADTLLAEGVSSEFTSGTSFWTNYGRLLFNAAPNQPFYNGTGFNKPVLRSPNTDYLIESTESWAKGFFYILNSPESQYTLVTIPTTEGNNTLSSEVSCPNYLNSSYGLDSISSTYIDLLPTFLQSAVNRLSTYAPGYTDFSATDVFTLQLLCIYEYYALDNSDACSLFTIEEWQGFEYILDILGYYGYSFGQPAGRALGLGYLEELLARLNNEFITTSSSSVNSTLDSSSTTFPLNETFYFDMSDESTIVSFLTALSLDYFRESLPTTSITSRNFKLGLITPFSGHLITEKIGCTQPNPTATNSNSTIYTKGQNGYSAAEATNKFIRIRLNNGILPLSTIRGGLCSDRTDGLCSLSNFIQSQSNASVEANYEFICFGSYVFNQSEFEYDGNYGISSPPIETTTTESNITIISQYWSQFSSYKANDNDEFGIEDTGLPDGCQVEQVHVLQRNGERLPSEDEFQLMSTFATQVTALKGTFTGPLSYLNAWSLQLASGGLLAEGVSNEFTSGTSFWTNYGRLLFNAAPNQPFYNGTGFNKPVLRSPDTDYLIESTESWAKGFFYILNSPESQYTLVTIPTSEGNNTLASVISCPNYLNSSYGLDPVGNTYIDLLPTFLQSAVDRLSTYAPGYGNFSATDVFTLQLLCIYEYYAFDNSDACSLFTVEEWQGFEYILDILGYYGYSFGQPAGRALGLGYLQELLARLNNEYITESSSSVNSTLDSSATTFPLNETFYLDMTYGSTIVSFLTTISLDYFRESLATTSITTRNFKLGKIAPFSGHLITEKIGCTEPNPTATNSNSTIYTKGQNGYSAAEATNKFIRIRLNNGILPLSTIRGGLCSDRTDGLCSLSDFTQSQSNATSEANYEFICFGSYVFNETLNNGDGNYFASI